MGAGGQNSVANGQILDINPQIIRDPAHNKASWDWVAAHTRAKVLPQIESTGDTGFLSWAVNHPAFSGIVELSNEPFWAAGHTPYTAQAWVQQWGPVIDFIKRTYPNVKMTAPIDDWPTAHDSSPGTAGWTQQLLAARPALKTEMYGWAIHPYCDSGGAPCALQHLQNGINALKANGVSSPNMYATEWGWSRGVVSESTQAANAQAFLASTPPELKASFWYQINDNYGSSARENGFGLYRFLTLGDWGSWTSVSAKNVIKAAAATA
jgi:hypothetical protein